MTTIVLLRPVDFIVSDVMVQPVIGKTDNRDIPSFSFGTTRVVARNKR